jgi:hypothetical protein
MFDPRIVRIVRMLRVLCEVTGIQELWLSMNSFGGMNVSCYTTRWSSKFYKTSSFIAREFDVEISWSHNTSVMGARERAKGYANTICVFNEHSRKHYERLTRSGNYES